jgi:hypothetical protein
MANLCRGNDKLPLRGQPCRLEVSHLRVTLLCPSLLRFLRGVKLNLRGCSCGLSDDDRNGVAVYCA